MSDLIDPVRTAIESRRLLPAGCRFLIGVSGGLDSMVLLHVLHRLTGRFGWGPIVVHFNHRLRGRASDGDEAFVHRAAGALGIEFAAGRGDVREHAKRMKISVEMAARELRHRFFAEAAKARKISVVVLGHQADDQLELFFLRLLRGAGPEGLVGMPWRGPSPVDREVTLVRPLLEISRKELERFAREEGIAYREDATNRQVEFVRNRVRRVLIPLLEEQFQPALGRTISRLQRLLADESEFIDRAVRDWESGKRRGRFEDLPVALQRRILRKQALDLGFSSDFDRTEWLRTHPGEELMIRPGLIVVRDAEGRLRRCPKGGTSFETVDAEFDLEGKTGTLRFGGGKVSWRIERVREKRKRGFVGARPGRGWQAEYFDAEKVGSRITLRYWRPGDRFQPLGLRSPAKLQDLFTNAKVPREERRWRVIGATAGGEIFWVEGLRISERFKLDEGTRLRLRWEWNREPGAVEGVTPV